MKKDEYPYHILVVEDNLGDFVILEEYLSNYLINAQIDHAVDFQAASILLNDTDNHFNLVFLDLTLPDKSGEELVLDMIKLTTGIPVVVLTGFADLEFGSRSLALGTSDYLVKDDLSPAVLYKTLIYNIQRLKYISALKESNTKYSDLFQLNPSPIFLYDQETLKILDVNEAICQKYGYSREELLSMVLGEIRPKSEHLVSQKSIEEFWKKKSKKHKLLTKHLTKDGEILDVELNIAKVRINNRDAGLVLVNDITENQKYIRKIEEQNTTFKEISWIQSHVVRAPLARIMGLVSLLEIHKHSLTKELSELLEYMKSSADELDAVIKDISEKLGRVYD